MRCFLILILFISGQVIYSQDYINQKYDRQRIIMPFLGPGCLNLDTTNHVYINGVIFDFRSDTLEQHPVDTFEQSVGVPYYTLYEAAQICNKEGKITAYFNGGELWDRFQKKILVDIFMNAAEDQDFALAYLSNSSLIIPLPNQDSIYLLIGCTDLKMDDRYGVRAGEQISTVTFREMQDGSLKILSRNRGLHQSKYTFESAMTAVRHANGRDWWVVCPKRWGKYFNIFRLDPQGLHFSHESSVQDTILDGAFDAVFSPDGQFYARGEITKHISMYQKINKIQIFPFDRCSGTFGEPVSFQLPLEDTSSFGQGIFDRTSRYLYISTCASLYQADMYADDIPASLIKVCGYDQQIKDSKKLLCIASGFLAPDGKIYMFDGNNNFRTTVINNPSERGLACDARYADLMKISCTGMSLGNMPDFNLGPADGTVCDSLGLDAVSIHRNVSSSVPLTISPSPTIGDCTVMLPSQGGRLAVYDARGHITLSYIIQNYQMEQALSLPQGVYYIAYHSTDGLINAGGKVVVLR